MTYTTLDELAADFEPGDVYLANLRTVLGETREAYVLVEGYVYSWRDQEAADAYDEAGETGAPDRKYLAPAILANIEGNLGHVSPDEIVELAPEDTAVLVRVTALMD